MRPVRPRALRPGIDRPEVIGVADRSQPTASRDWRRSRNACALVLLCRCIADERVFRNRVVLPIGPRLICDAAGCYISRARSRTAPACGDCRMSADARAKQVASATGHQALSYMAASIWFERAQDGTSLNASLVDGTFRRLVSRCNVEDDRRDFRAQRKNQSLGASKDPQQMRECKKSGNGASRCSRSMLRGKSLS